MSNIRKFLIVTRETQIKSITNLTLISKKNNDKNHQYNETKEKDMISEAKDEIFPNRMTPGFTIGERQKQHFPLFGGKSSEHIMEIASVDGDQISKNTS
jgi:hypothetical protein